MNLCEFQNTFMFIWFIKKGISMEKNLWSDDQFDYFRTIYGILYCSPRNFEREAAEARYERARARVRLMNLTLKVGVVALVVLDVAALVVFAGGL